jgi:hypothetical protein
MFISKKIQALCTIDEINVELQQRNNLRLVEAKEKMGKTYLLHPENAMSRAKFQAISKVTESK